MNTRILNLISQYEEPGDFTHSTISDEQIEEAQTLLALRLPSQYIEFLKSFGHGGIGGIEIIGIGKNGKLLFVNETITYREYGLPNNYIVIENCDEWVYCIDSTDASIKSWSRTNTDSAYPDFDTYLLDRFSDAAENI